MTKELLAPITSVVRHLTLTAADAEALAAQLEVFKAQAEHAPSQWLLAQWVASFFEIKTRLTELDETLKRANRVKDYFEKAFLPTLFEEAGEDLIRIPELGRSFSVQVKYSASMVEGHREEAFQWLRDNGRDAYIQETVNAGTLSSAFKKMVIEEGIDPPPDLFNFRSYKTIGSAKYTPKGDILEAN